MQPDIVTSLAWPSNRGAVEGIAGTGIDSLLVGRRNGSVAILDVFDASTFHLTELPHCARHGGE